MDSWLTRIFFLALFTKDKTSKLAENLNGLHAYESTFGLILSGIGIVFFLYGLSKLALTTMIASLISFALGSFLYGDNFPKKMEGLQTIVNKMKGNSVAVSIVGIVMGFLGLVGVL